jgi:ribosomal protein L7/L12
MAATNADVMDVIAKMTVLELSDLIKQMAQERKGRHFQS